MRRLGRAWRFIILAIVAILASSCDSDRAGIGPPAATAVRPDEAGISSEIEVVKEIDRETGPKGFYRLIVGDTRTYRTESSEQLTWDDGTQEPVSALTITTTKKVVCVSFQEGREYFTETSTYDSGHSVTRWYSWEDRDGLHRRYQLAGPPCRPEAEAIVATPQTGIEYASELMLAYPLHAGARWAPDVTHPEYEAVVEGVDVVNVPAGRFVAWRIRMPKSDPTSANDAARYWYSREGYIKSARNWHYSVPANGPIQGYSVSGSYSEVLISRTIEPE
jgi:hypothetical protein